MSLLKFFRERGWLNEQTRENGENWGPHLQELDPSELKVFEPEHLLSLFNHEAPETAFPLIAGVLKKALEMQEKRLKDLQIAVAERNQEKISFLGHQLKGSYAATGSPLLANLGAGLEEMGKRGDWPAILESQPKLLTLHQLYQKQVTHFLATRWPPGNAH